MVRPVCAVDPDRLHVGLAVEVAVLLSIVGEYQSPLRAEERRLLLGEEHHDVLTGADRVTEVGAGRLWRQKCHIDSLKVR